MAADDANFGSGGRATTTGGHGAPPAPASASHSAAEAQPDPMLGQVIDGRYKILSKLGEGGMGEVYACEHIGLKKKMAVKLLRAEIVTNEEAVARFRQEAQSASAIRHKNIIEISDIGELQDKRVYMCMEFLEGQAFNDMLKQPVDPTRALNILIQTCDGLSAAHRHNIIHRDMKPENIFVTVHEGIDVPKLLDFGIAKVSGNDGQNNLTRTGTIFGTPFYMAPEQALGQTVDHRADVYSLGVIMYEVFTGSVPFKADSFMAILTQHITTEPKPPGEMAAEHGRTVPPGFTEIINRCMRKDPNERYATMDELKAVLVERYRALAGPGMSAYFNAQGGPSGPMSAQAAAAYAPTSGPQGMPHASMPTPMPHPTGTTSAYGAELAPKKSKAWLIALLLVVFLGGGGAAGYIYWQSQQGGGDDGEAVAALYDAGAEVDETGTDPAGTGTDVVAEPVVPDAGTVITPPAEMVPVLVNSKPQRAEVFLGSESQGFTPVIVEVPKGEQTALVLRRKRYRDAEIVVDGSKRKITERLKRERRGDKGDKGDKGHGDKGDGDGKPNPFGDGKKDDKKDDKIEDGLIDDDSDLLE